MSDETRKFYRMRAGQTWRASQWIGWFGWVPLFVLSRRWPVFEFFAWVAGFVLMAAIAVWLYFVINLLLSRDSVGPKGGRE